MSEIESPGYCNQIYQGSEDHTRSGISLTSLWPINHFLMMGWLGGGGEGSSELWVTFTLMMDHSENAGPAQVSQVAVVCLENRLILLLSQIGETGFADES